MNIRLVSSEPLNKKCWGAMKKSLKKFCRLEKKYYLYLEFKTRSYDKSLF